MTTVQASSINYGTFGEVDFNLEAAIEFASQSKQAFITLINELELHISKPWIIKYLQETFTDAMASIFFDRYWNGSLDTVTLYTESGELPSLIDDIGSCVDGMTI